VHASLIISKSVQTFAIRRESQRAYDNVF